MQLWTVIALAWGVVLVGAATFQLTRSKAALPSGKPEGGAGAARAPEEARKSAASAAPAEPKRKSKEPPTGERKSLPKVAEPTEEEDDSELTLITLSPQMPSLAKIEGEGDEREDEGLPTDAPAKPIVVDDDAADDEPTRASPFILVSAAGQTDKGQKRKNNEDSYLVLDEHGLFVVADGMGGYAGGEVASALTVEMIEKAFKKQKFEGPPYDNVPRRGSELARSIQMANKAVYDKAHADPMLKGMGTTVVAARFSLNKQRLYLGHVGDSRCYRLREDKLEQITTDHTMAALGFTGPAFAHRLNRAVGTAPSVEIDLIIGRPRPGDTYLLCSDGLSDMVEDEEIRLTLITLRSNPQLTVQQLVQAANDNGGRDNISAMLIRVAEPFGVPRGWLARFKALFQ